MLDEVENVLVGDRRKLLPDRRSVEDVVDFFKDLGANEKPDMAVIDQGKESRRGPGAPGGRLQKDHAVEDGGDHGPCRDARRSARVARNSPSSSPLRSWSLMPLASTASWIGLRISANVRSRRASFCSTASRTNVSTSLPDAFASAWRRSSVAGGKSTVIVMDRSWGHSSSIAEMVPRGRLVNP